MHLLSCHNVIKKNLALLTCAGMLSGCDAQKSSPKILSEASYPEEQTIVVSADVANMDAVAVSAPQEKEESAGRKLTEIAGQATLPAEKHKHKEDGIADTDLQYVGRYRVNIPCEDEFAHCEKGQAEYILNLLADGTAHRTIVNLGRIYNDSISRRDQFYRQDTWSYDHAENEIVIHLVEGYNFYYKVADPHHLVIHLEKNLQQVTEDLDGTEEVPYPQPDKAYVLKKAED